MVVLPKEELDSIFIYRFVFPGTSDLGYACLPGARDDLVLNALFRVLTRHVMDYPFFMEHNHSFFSSNGFEMFKEVRSWGKVEMLMHINLTPSLNSISRDRLLEKLETFVSDRVIFTLVKSFLNISILTDKGKDMSLYRGIPPANLITCFLLYFFLYEFDLAMFEVFPFPYTRYRETAILALKCPEEVSSFSLDKLEWLLKELTLKANVTRVVKGGLPIPCCGGKLSLDEEGNIHFL